MPHQPAPIDRAAELALRAALALPLALCAGLALAGVQAAPAEPSLPACESAVDLRGELTPAQRAEIRAEAEAEPNGRGRLWRVEGAGEPSFLFGTMHLSDPRVVALPPAAQAAFAGADRLVVETVDIRDPAAMSAALFANPTLTQLPAGTTLADLSEDEADRARLDTALEEAGTPPASVRTLQPWFVAAALVTPPCEAERMAAGAPVLDLDLMDRAEGRGQALAGLETAGEQMEALASLPLDAQLDNLLATLDLQDRLPDIFETMTQLYLDGDIAAIAPTIERLAPEGSDAAESAAIYAEFERRVVTERNHRMAERLGPLLEEGGNFVAVGALHLPGEDGLVSLLREAGWTLSPAS